jgi:hypothetical protein
VANNNKNNNYSAGSDAQQSGAAYTAELARLKKSGADPESKGQASSTNQANVYAEEMAKLKKVNA